LYFCSMNTNIPAFKIEGSIFKFLSGLFKKHGVRGILVGGYALVANNVQRMTFDIDFMVKAEDCKKIEPDLLNAGYSIFNRQDAFVQFKSTIPGLRDIDFLIGDARTLEKIIAQGKEIPIAGESFLIPSPLHLIEMKLHSISGNRRRELKDFPDIVQLLSANAIDPAGANIKELFDKYKLRDLYEKIINAPGEENG
jgi:hypothetical protein